MVLRFLFGFAFGIACFLYHYRSALSSIFAFRRSPLTLTEQTISLRIFLLFCGWIVALTHNVQFIPWVMLALVLSYLDIRDKRIHVFFIFPMIILSLSMNNLSFYSLILPAVLLSIQATFYAVKGKNNLGLGDIILSVGCGAFITQPSELGMMLLLTGIFGVATSLFVSEREIPLVPSLMLSTWIIQQDFHHGFYHGFYHGIHFS